MIKIQPIVWRHKTLNNYQNMLVMKKSPNNMEAQNVSQLLKYFNDKNEQFEIDHQMCHGLSKEIDNGTDCHFSCIITDECSFILPQIIALIPIRV